MAASSSVIFYFFLGFDSINLVEGDYFGCLDLYRKLSFLVLVKNKKKRKIKLDIKLEFKFELIKDYFVWKVSIVRVRPTKFPWRATKI